METLENKKIYFLYGEATDNKCNFFKLTPETSSHVIQCPEINYFWENEINTLKLNLQKKKNITSW